MNIFQKRLYIVLLFVGFIFLITFSIFTGAKGLFDSDLDFVSIEGISCTTTDEGVTLELSLYNAYKYDVEIKRFTVITEDHTYTCDPPINRFPSGTTNFPLSVPADKNEIREIKVTEPVLLAPGKAPKSTYEHTIFKYTEKAEQREYDDTIDSWGCYELCVQKPDNNSFFETFAFFLIFSGGILIAPILFGILLFFILKKENEPLQICFFCPKCGHKLYGTNLCPRCGTRIPVYNRVFSRSIYSDEIFIGQINKWFETYPQITILKSEFRFSSLPFSRNKLSSFALTYEMRNDVHPAQYVICIFSGKENKNASESELLSQLSPSFPDANIVSQTKLGISKGANKLVLIRFTPNCAQPIDENPSDEQDKAPTEEAQK